MGGIFSVRQLLAAFSPDVVSQKITFQILSLFTWDAKKINSFLI
jgi:hypothetical protein